MIADIVIDTNIFLHAENPLERRREDAQSLLIALHQAPTKLCVDEGFSLEEAQNRSLIGSEYLRHLRFGMLGLAIVSHLAAAARVKTVSRSVPGAIGRIINRNIRSANDRVFARVAFNFQERVLACHDFVDIPQRSREELRGGIGVSIVCAGEALDQFD